MESNLKICVDCNNYLHDIYQFVAKTKLIDAMFLEIEQIEHQHQPEVNSQEMLIHDDISQLQDCEIPPALHKEFEYEKSVNSVRHKFGLQPLEMQVEAISNLFDETNITGALEIKLESDTGDFEAHDVLSDDQEEFSESSEEEDDSEIEQLSDSQLRKHEERLQSGREQSPDLEDRKKTKRKYRKSDEEKLFE